MKLLFPLTITSSMIKAGTTIAEPDTGRGESSWASGGTYALAVEKIYDHKTYSCVQAHTGRTTTPDLDAAYWLVNERKPANRWAPFDWYTDTPAVAATTLTYVLQPGFFNGLSIYNPVGSAIAITVKDAPGGTTTLSYTSDLYDQALGLYELLFLPLRQRTKLVLSDIPISPTSEITLTITGSGTVSLGMLNIGTWMQVVGAGDWGGVQYGASAEPKSYSYIKFNDDGTGQIKRRGKSTDMRGVVVMAASSADYAHQLVQQVLDVPVSIVCTPAAGYDYLNVFGLISGSVKADGPAHASFDFSVKGFL